MFSAEKLRYTNVSANTNFSVIRPGQLIDPNIAMDTMFVINSSGSSPLTAWFDFVHKCGDAILTAWPSSYTGLAAYSDFGSSPDANFNSVPYETRIPLAAHTKSDINSWTFGYTGGDGARDSGLNTIMLGATASDFNWRPIAANRRKVIILCCDVPPDERGVTTSNPDFATSAECIATCINNQVWPIRLEYYANPPYYLAYGGNYHLWSGLNNGFGFGNDTDANAFIPMVLGSMYNGLIQ